MTTAPEYRCIVADPPWAEYGGGGRGAQCHYGLLETPEIARVMLRAPDFRPSRNCHFWCWVTDNFLLDGLALIDRLGFRYIRTFVWVKGTPDGLIQQGLGQYARGSHELCLFSACGDSMLPDVAPKSVIVAPRQEHSRKPDESFASWFETVSPGPRLEMFARTSRPGWDAWGNQAPTPN